MRERIFPPPGYMAISEEILKTGVFLPLHPFIDQVLDFFDIVSFQLSQNSYCLIVAIYIAFLLLWKIALISISPLFSGSRP